MSKNIRFSVFICITTLLIKWTNSYVLLAANLEDFKKVAKKFVPEKLAMQIANIATASPMNRDYYDVPEAEVARIQEYVPNQEAAVEEKEPVQESEANQEEEVVKHENNRPNPDEYEENPRVKQLDFEDLVQQVKERIEKDLLKKKLLQSNMNQQAKSYASIEPEDIEKRKVERKRPEKYTEQRYREGKGPERKPRQPREPEDKYTEKKRYSKINHSDGKRPESVYHKEESYIDQEYDSSRQQTKNNGYNMQHNRDIKQNKDREDVKLSETPNEEYENPHDRDEIDQGGKVIYNHHEYEEKQRQPKYTSTFKYEDQLRTVSPDTHGKYKENKKLPVEEDDETLLYTKISMIRNDSYEDYVTPKKEKNVYASNESHLKERADVTKTAKTTAIIIPLAAKVTNEYEEDEKNYDYDDNANDPKARTEILDYNYDTNQETESKSSREPEQTTPMTKVSSSTQKRKHLKKGKATMIPKRDFYKISSPNYYAKIPIVAEKYDFNEPIPEKDRDPEDTRSFPMPPSAINGKVKVK